MPLDVTEQAKKQFGYNIATASEFPYVGSDRPNLHHIKCFVRNYEKV